MAVLRTEGFDYTDVTHYLRRNWFGIQSGIASTAGQSMVTGRFGTGQALRLSSATLTPVYNFLKASDPTATFTTLYFGFAFRGNTVATSTFDNYVTIIGTPTGPIFRLGLDGSGHLRVKNAGGTVIATGTTALANNTWYYIEFKLVVAGASGSIEVRLGTNSGTTATEIASTTGNFGTDPARYVALQNLNNASHTQDFDDLYVVDTSGSYNTSWLGNSRADALYPTAEGNTINFTPSTGSDNAALVDEASGTFPNDDTDYNSSSSVGDKDTFVFGDSATETTNVHSVTVLVFARSDDAGLRQVASVIRDGGADSVGTDQPVSHGYGFKEQVYNADPNGSAWTKTSVDADEFGYKLTN